MAEQTASKVPQIRFKGFEDGWLEDLLGERVEFFSGLTYSPRNVQKGVGTLVLRSSNVKNGEIVNADNVYVDPNIVNSKNVEVGDIAVVVRNGSRSLIGKHAQIKSEMDNTVIGAFMTGIHSKNSAFTNALLDTPQFDREIAKNLGATINQITTGAFRQMLFRFPSPSEQTKIGKYFRELDSLIGLHQRKHDKLVTLKKAMLQKMFPQPGATTPEIRFKGFSGDWVEKKLGDIGLFYRGISYNHKNVSESGLLVLRSTNIQNARLIFNSDLQFINMKCPEDITLRKGDIAICMSNGSKSLVGKSALCEIEPASPTTVGAFCSIFRSANPVAPHLFQTATYSKYLNELLAGSSINNLKNSDLNELIFGMPVDGAEQQKIGAYFRTLDELIAKHATQLQKLQQIKSACLARMFV